MRVGWWWGGGGSSLGSCSEGVGQHERQDVMVYSAQEWGRRGQGVPCPQHQPQRDLQPRWQTPLSAGKSLKKPGVICMDVRPCMYTAQFVLRRALVCGLFMCACVHFIGCRFFNLWLERVHAWPNRGATLINYKLTHIDYKIHKKRPGSYRQCTELGSQQWHQYRNEIHNHGGRGIRILYIGKSSIATLLKYSVTS